MEQLTTLFLLLKAIVNNTLIDIWFTKDQLTCLITALKEYSWDLGGHVSGWMPRSTERSKLESIIQHLEHINETNTSRTIV